MIEYAGNINNALFIDSFDYNGYLVQRTCHTHGTHIIYGKLVFSYDGNGNLQKEIYYTTKAHDTATNKLVDRNDTIETIISHDNLNRVIKKSYADKSNISMSDIVYSYDPMIEKHTYSINHHPRETEIYYDEFSEVKLITWKEPGPDGQMLEKSRREYKNVYDERNRLKKCKFIDTPCAKNYYGYEIIKLKYYYLDNGLLGSRVSINRDGNKITTEYHYTYW